MASKQKRLKGLKEKKRRDRERMRRAKQGHTADRRAALENLKEVARTFQVPRVGRWPGGCDAPLARPDLIKYELAKWAMKSRIWRMKLRDLEFDYKRGRLDFLPEVEHWAMEEFFWHGLPGDTWHPIEAWLDHVGDRFSPAAGEQLRRWKEAELGLFEIGELREDTVALRPWDAVRMAPAGAWVRSIDLAIPGVNLYKGREGSVTITYLAPWAPEDNLFCAMGYGLILPPASAPALRMHLHLADVNLARSRWPWEENRRANEAFARRWKIRDWQSWLAKRVELPLEALVSLPSRGPSVVQIRAMIPAPRATAEVMGIYFATMVEEEALVLGATTIMPLDISTRSAEALAEYHAFRKLVGPPPGMRGAPKYMELGR